eukprot:754170-Hanusia_phi.AAC.1
MHFGSKLRSEEGRIASSLSIDQPPLIRHPVASMTGQVQSKRCNSDTSNHRGKAGVTARPHKTSRAFPHCPWGHL